LKIIMSANPPSEVPSAPKLSTPRSANPTDPQGLRYIVIPLLLPMKVGEDGKVTMLTAGMWHAGENAPGVVILDRLTSIVCGPEGFVYESEEDMSPDETVNDPLKMGLMAQRAHEIFLSEEEPAAARSHFLLLLDSLWTGEHPETD
jgi:hypothetical protein